MKIKNREKIKLKELDSPKTLRKKGIIIIILEDNKSSRKSTGSQPILSRRTVSSYQVDKKENEVNLIEKYSKFLDKVIDNKINKKVLPEDNLVGSKDILIKTSLLTLLFCTLLSAYFLIVIWIDLSMKNFIETSLNIFDFQQKRGFYLVNSIIYFKHSVLSQNPSSIQTYLNYTNESITNEAHLQKFALEDDYRNFDSILLQIDTSNICVFFQNNAGLNVSNNLTTLTPSICNTVNNFTSIIQKSLFEIMSIITNNYLMNLYSNYTFIQDKSNFPSLTILLNDLYYQFTQILSQYVVRQAIFLIINQIDMIITARINQYYSISIAHCILFLLFVIIVVSVSNLVAYNIFKDKKKRNELIIVLLPYEFLRKQFEDEEEQKKKIDHEQ